MTFTKKVYLVIVVKLGLLYYIVYEEKGTFMKLQKDEKLLLIIITVYSLAATMVTTFANVYLMDYTSSYTVISIYSMIRYGALALFAVFSAKLSRFIKVSQIMMFGLILITSAVLFLLETKELIVENHNIIYLVGLIWGAGEGCFWISMNTLIQICTNPATRGPYLGVHAALGSLANIFAPLLSAQILMMADIEIEGYYTMFRIAIGIFIFITFVAMFFNVKKLPLKFSLIKCFKDVKTSFEWRYVIIAQFLFGFRDAATISLTGLLIYEAIGSSTAYGELLTVLALVGTISNLIIGKVVKKHNRLKYLVFGSVCLFLSGISLVVFRNEFGVYMHGALQYIFLPFIVTPFSIIVMNIINDYMKTENVIGRTVSREIMIGLSRVVGLFVFIVLLKIMPGRVGMDVSLIVIYSSCLLFAAYTIKYDLKKRPRKKIDFSQDKM